MLKPWRESFQEAVALQTAVSVYQECIRTRPEPWGVIALKIGKGFHRDPLNQAKFHRDCSCVMGVMGESTSARKCQPSETARASHIRNNTLVMMLKSTDEMCDFCLLVMVAKLHISQLHSKQGLFCRTFQVLLQPGSRVVTVLNQ